MTTRLHASTRQMIAEIFQALDYTALASIYCDEGGELFWLDQKGPCQQLGAKLAIALRPRLQPGGRSLYVGAGVAEIPILVMESMELEREVIACSLRQEEVTVLNHACQQLPLTFEAADARSATGHYDHIWMVSVLNDPEQFPELSALSYGRANPVTFNPSTFVEERTTVTTLAIDCFNKLASPGQITCSVEEIPWITHWSTTFQRPCIIDEKDYPTAIVGDPICFITVPD
ncbi:MAG: hypothetical protein GKS05_10075 [Nitrospirales bacterium]|nr:hypothetical protein [Nitrospirales bacterium]